ncbi:MAG: hypothetical protein J0G94_13315 [Sphingomonadales bacterium]|nr:hypothetical protein [Sphingomonadales bacterium]
MKVAIRGSGVAASAAARLLARENIETVLLPAPRAKTPVVMLSDPARALLCDVFADPALFADRARIDRRIVAWGGGEPVTLPHGAVILAESDLDTLRPPSATSDGADADIIIHAAAPFPASEVQRFAARHAEAVEVALRFREDHSACWIEAVADGWLFLIPVDSERAWLLCVGGAAERLMDQSRHVTARVDPIGPASAQFDVSPRLLSSLQGPGWLACGTAAIAFDPICGDGTAQALREAILASAVIAAMAQGGDAQALRLHHESMLIAAMRRHLKLCADFYRSGGQGPWWQAQLAALAEGFDWCTSLLATRPEPRYQLRDFHLIEREAAA